MIEQPANVTSLLAAKPIRRDKGQYEYKPVEISTEGALKVSVDNGLSERLAGFELQTADGLVYQAVQHISDLVIYVANTSAGARTFQLNHVPPGGASANANCIVAVTTPLAVGQTLTFTVPVLGIGEAIRGLCSSNSTVTVTIYGKRT